MKHTKIQWSDSTINPVAGCDGCPLYPTTNAVIRSIDKWLTREQASANVKSILNGHTLSDIYHRNQELGNLIAMNASRPELAAQIAKELRKPVRCYAAILHMIRGKDPRNPSKKTNRGYAPTFEEVTLFPGRMAEAARWSDLRGTNRPDAPWKNGLPRMIFISDMGDSLSKDVSFEYLKSEIIDNVGSVSGQRHIWLWLTKRPAKMAQFDRWLEARGIPWPPNLVPMCSVMNQRMATGLTHLRKIRALCRGISVEPLVESVQLDLQGIDWLIVGGESGNSAMPFELEWVRQLRSQCADACTALFVKQLGRRPLDNGNPLRLDDRHGGDWSEWPDDLTIRLFPAAFRVLQADRAAAAASGGKR